MRRMGVLTLCCVLLILAGASPARADREFRFNIHMDQSQGEVDALLRHDQVAGVVSHAARNGTLKATNRYARIWRKYQPLYNLSRTVRYLADPGRWVRWEDIETNVLPRYLYPLEDSVQELMAEPLDLPPVAVRSS